MPSCLPLIEILDSHCSADKHKNWCELMNILLRISGHFLHQLNKRAAFSKKCELNIGEMDSSNPHTNVPEVDDRRFCMSYFPKHASPHLEVQSQRILSI